MGDNVLKKEFSYKDINRARNIIKGSPNESTQNLVGYKKSTEVRKEGDIWEEGNKIWTIKGGIKQNIPKVNRYKPLFCPLCSQILKDKDYKIFNNHGRCLNCQTTFETKLKIDGKWEEYKNNLMNEDIDHFVEDYSLWVEEELQKENSSIYITEGGDRESWRGNIKNKILKDKEETIDYLNKLRL